MKIIGILNMFFDRKIVLPIMAIVLLSSSGCQKQEVPNATIIEENESGVNIKPTQPSVVPTPNKDTKLEQEQFTKLEPVSDSEFDALMKKNEDNIKSSNAMLNTLDSSVELENDDSIVNDEYSATKTITTSSNTELDAVNQAIQAALPALEE